eukprot:CAMPEP_0184269602 /NCGR_PEP_ID=MMETSP0977-20130417/35216_1 /TAXON_ID=483370 /ORGANISM="non described non described, Strain CCMP2097" /LENGTH=42 /DNA_ID= /DNA_START= /DNA_END= /DNA_ORIENTATION=
MPYVTRDSRRARARADAAALALRVFEQSDLLTKHVARDARAV